MRERRCRAMMPYACCALLARRAADMRAIIIDIDAAICLRAAIFMPRC